jgi:DNA-binding winged helix-turn-helix (wHTH) protein/TolB-like protein
VRFDGFQLDLDTGELTGPGGTSRLQPKPAEMLGLLLSRAGALVTREELQRRLWPETTVDFDQSLNTCVRQIRAALGEGAGDGSRIETLPRRGYRLRVGVEPVLDAGARRRRGALGVLVCVGLAVALAAWWAGGGRRSAAAAGASDAATPRIAVLPLEDPGAGGGAARVNDLLTESLVVQLTAADPRLAVLGPATTGIYRGTQVAHTEIGSVLDVDFVVSGGYRAEEGVFFVQMIRARDGDHVFATRIDSREAPGDDAVREIVGGIVDELDAGD